MRKLTTHIKNLISELKSEGIRFSFDQQITVKSNGDERRLENVIFEKNNIQYKLYEGVFFRDFGQSMYFKKIKGGEIVLTDFDDLIFYEMLTAIILKYFEKNG